MKGARKFLMFNRLDTLDKNTTWGAFKPVALPVVSVKEIQPYTAEANRIPEVAELWSQVHAVVIMKDETRWYAQETMEVLVERIETPFTKEGT